MTKSNKLINNVITEQPKLPIPPGYKDDKGKPMYSYIPFKQLEHLSDVFEYGAQKYEKDNWKLKEIEWDRQFSAIMRHLIEAQQDPYATDPESGELHITHAISQLMMRLYWYDENYIENETLASQDEARDTHYAEGYIDRSGCMVNRRGYTDTGVEGVQDGDKTPGKI